MRRIDYKGYQIFDVLRHYIIKNCMVFDDNSKDMKFKTLAQAKGWCDKKTKGR